jgi:hypothetical protein
MPKGDRTGPMGQGPGTGRVLGMCSGYEAPGYAKGFGRNMGRGFGFNRGRGMGIGCGRGRYFGVDLTESNYVPIWSQPISKNDEIKMLKTRAELLKQSQKNIEKKLSELEKED